MVIERTKNEIIIRLPASLDVDDLQDMINYARYKEITSTFKVKQNNVDKIATEINKKWWTRSRKRLTQ